MSNRLKIMENNKKLFQQRDLIEEEINTNKCNCNGCNHIMVLMTGDTKNPPFYNYRSRCLICEEEVLVDREDYDADCEKMYIRKYLNGVSDEQDPRKKDDEKFYLLQKWATDIIKENPDISDRELVVSLANKIYEFDGITFTNENPNERRI